MSWALPQDNAMLLHWLVFIPAEHIYLSQGQPSGLLNIMMKLKLNANTYTDKASYNWIGDCGQGKGKGKTLLDQKGKGKRGSHQP